MSVERLVRVFVHRPTWLGVGLVAIPAIHRKLNWESACLRVVFKGGVGLLGQRAGLSYQSVARLALYCIGLYAVAEGHRIASVQLGWGQVYGQG